MIQSISPMRHPGVAALLLAWPLFTTTASAQDTAAPSPAATTTTVAAAAASAVPAAAAEPPEPREWFGSNQQWHQWSRMTGDWGSWRAALENKGITVLLGAIADASTAARGETGTRAVGRSLFDAGVEVDLGKAGVGPGRLVVGYQHKGGGIGADCVEDGQGFSNIDAPDFHRLVEAWYELPIGTRARVKVGWNDANSEFAYVENGAEFLNSSMGFSPSIFAMPTYPNPQLGLVVQTQPTAWSYAGGGIYNGGPALGVGRFEAAFAIAEAGLRWERFGGGRAGVGYWHVSGGVAAEDGSRGRMSTGGQYVVLDQTVWTDGRTEQPRRIGAFLQVGLADATLTPIARHVGAGLIASGLVPGRPDDAIGVGLTTVRFGDTDCPVPPQGEANIGAFYKLALAGWLALKPDVQVIINPVGDPTRQTLVVSTLRVEIGF
jgi:porin